MFVRQKPNKSGSVSVQVIDRSNGYRVVKSIGTARDPAEVARLVALGAAEVAWDYPPDADFVVLADPDGTLFCIIDTGFDSR